MMRGLALLLLPLGFGCGAEPATGAYTGAPTTSSNESGGERSDELRVGGDGTGFVATTIRDRHREVGQGRPAVSDVDDQTLETNDRHRLEVQVEGGHCYVAIAVGVPSVRTLDLRILDPFGNERATDETEDAFPAAAFCPSVAGSWIVELHMFNGYGRVGAQVFGSEGP
ncbi:MAG: hypothetical protein AAGF12_15360 [Myxococcota bacterium]